MLCAGNWEIQTNSEADKAEHHLFSKIKGNLTVNSDKSVFLHIFSKIKGNLTVNSGKPVFLHENLIVIPITLQKRAMMMAMKFIKEL